MGSDRLRAWPFGQGREEQRICKTSGIELIGRAEEQSAIDALLDSARDGMSGALVIRGEPGIGKTAMLDYAINSSRDFIAVRADGIESERDLSFAAIHRVLMPFLAESESLPDPQRRALDATFGRIRGTPTDRFLIGLATLTLLAQAAASRPLLCVIDDAQWIDGESVDLLAFVARRLYAEGVAMLFSIREPVEGADPFAGLQSMRLAGLDSAGARQLLAAIVPASLDVITTGRIVAETQGNPLGLIELGQDAGQDGWGVALLPDEPLPLGDRLEARFRRQVESLPESAQRFLLIAAAEPTNSEVVWKAAEMLRLPADAARPAVNAQLYDPRHSPPFRHPLIRSAVYSASTPSERRRVHSVLAGLADPSDEDGRAWHLAAAAEGPDETTAAELVRSAARAQSRGGWAARAAFLARAAELTPLGPRRVERLLESAEAAVVAGAPGRAQTLLDQARTMTDDPLLVAEAQRVEAGLLSFVSPGRVPAILLEAATALAPLESKLARDTFTASLQACLVSCQLTVGTTPALVGEAALASRSSPPGVEIADVMLDAFSTRFAIGYRESVPALQRGVEMLCAESTPPAGLTRWAVLGTDAAVDLWDADGYRRLTRRLEQAERERGALDSLRITLGCIGHDLMWAGDFAGAEVAHSEATEIAVALGGEAANWEALKVELFAWEGRDEETRFVASLCLSESTRAIGSGVVINLARVALVILDLAQGRYEDALVNALSVIRDDPCPHASQVLPLAVEAAVRSGDQASAVEVLGRLRERAIASGTAWGLGLLSQCDALTAVGDPEPSYLGALELLRKTYIKTDLARTYLLYGEWLRRKKRRSEAREQLRAAFELFDGMGATAFAERVRIELAATGERARRRVPDSTFELTPQERQIATQAAGGATNQEIAAKLYLSASTVDYHLRKVFRKLSVTSRHQLAAALL